MDGSGFFGCFCPSRWAMIGGRVLVGARWSLLLAYMYRSRVRVNTRAVVCVLQLLRLPLPPLLQPLLLLRLLHTPDFRVCVILLPLSWGGVVHAQTFSAVVQASVEVL